MADLMPVFGEVATIMKGKGTLVAIDCRSVCLSVCLSVFLLIKPIIIIIC